VAKAKLIETPVPRALARLRGTLDELLADPQHAGHEDDWVQATLTDPARPADAMELLRRRYPNAVELIFDPQGASDVPGGSFARRLKGLDDRALMADFVEVARGTPASDEESALLDDALAAGRISEVSA
jgi:exonuclease SbcD